MSKDNDEIQLYMNYDEWIEGYQPFLKWIINELRCIRTNEPTTTEEEWSELSPKLFNSLLKGAASLQYVGDQDFYYNGEDMEILIKYRKDYKDMPKEEITWSLMKDVILLLENEEHQLEKIATSLSQ